MCFPPTCLTFVPPTLVLRTMARTRTRWRNIDSHLLGAAISRLRPWPFAMGLCDGGHSQVPAAEEAESSRLVPDGSRMFLYQNERHRESQQNPLSEMIRDASSRRLVRQRILESIRRAIVALHATESGWLSGLVIRKGRARGGRVIPVRQRRSGTALGQMRSGLGNSLTVRGYSFFTSTVTGMDVMETD